MDILTLISSGPKKLSSDSQGSPISPGHVVQIHNSWAVNDSTKLSTFQVCKRKFFFQYLLGWDSDYKNHDLIFGTAAHIAKAHIIEKGYTPEAITEAFELFLKEYRIDFSETTDPDFSTKNPERFAEALITYATEYRTDKFKVLYTEVADKVIISNKYEIHFRIDAILEEEDGLIVRESKFSKWKSNNWGDTWFLKLQPGTYHFVLNCIAGDRPIKGVQMDGTFFYKNEIKHERYLLTMTEDELEAWRYTVVGLIEDILREFEILKTESPSAPAMKSFGRNGEACFAYYNKPCPYHTLCFAKSNPLRIVEENEGNPPSGFFRKWWDPTKVEDRFKPLKGERK